jgi:hypothetical protein
MKKDVSEAFCEHKNMKIVLEYISEGPNIVGNKVTALMRQIACDECNQTVIFVKALPVGK